jgi:hypothetical protein
MTRLFCIDDHAAIRARLEELARERAAARERAELAARVAENSVLLVPGLAPAAEQMARVERKIMKAIAEVCGAPGHVDGEVTAFIATVQAMRRLTTTWVVRRAEYFGRKTG